MPLESSIVRLHLTGDHRLAAAVAGAVENCAGQAGFDAADGASLAAAAQMVCKGAVDLAAVEKSPVDVTIECLVDRLVINVEHAGVAPAIGLDSFASSTPEPGGAPSGMELLRDIDRIEFHAQDGRARTTLVKFLPKKASAS
jgi:hypothetical protein